MSAAAVPPPSAVVGRGSSVRARRMARAASLTPTTPTSTKVFRVAMEWGTPSRHAAAREYGLDRAHAAAGGAEGSPAAMREASCVAPPTGAIGAVGAATSGADGASPRLRRNASVTASGSSTPCPWIELVVRRMPGICVHWACRDIPGKASPRSWPHPRHLLGFPGCGILVPKRGHAEC